MRRALALATPLLLLALTACPKKAPEPAAADPAPTEATAADPAPVVGDWLGALSIPTGKLRIGLHVTATDAGLAATLDSPDQGAFGLPADKVSWDGETLRVEMPALGALYTARRDGPALDGTFAQMGAILPLRLEPGVAAPPERPQEPALPLPYRSEEVAIAVGDHELAGTLTLPDGDGPHPAVVCITGSGPQDRDEALLGHRPFYVLADRLTRQGIAVLRYDDRGVGQSTGDFAAATSSDFAVDATAALTWLRARGDIGAAGFLGHSEGGIVAPLAAPGAAPDFLVLLAPPGIPTVELMLEQQEAVARSMGAPEDQVTARRDERRRILELLAAGDSAETRAELEAIYAAIPEMAALTESQRTEALEAQLTPWWQQFAAHDPAASLAAVEVPVFAAWGSLDVQVLADSNRAGMEAAIPASQLTAKTYDGLNHLFQHATTGSPAEYATLDETMSEEVMADIAAWVLSQGQAD